MSAQEFPERAQYVVRVYTDEWGTHHVYSRVSEAEVRAA